MSAWHIDALDARGGIAFASERDADLMDDLPAVDLPAIRIAPPAFEPEAMSSRTLAFAAGPGQFQLGLFVHGKELGFESMDSLIEFVRRAYTASGGGDGANGIGPPPPPPPDEGPTGPEPRRGFDGEAMAAIGHAAEEVAAASAEIGEELQSARALGFSSLAGFRPTAADMDPLVHAGSLLIDGLIDTLPDDEKDAAAWLDAVARLGGALTPLGLLGALRESRSWDVLADKLAAKAKRASWMEWTNGRFLLSRLFHDHRHVIVSRSSDGRIDALGWMPVDGRSSDPIDDLQSWPLPHRLSTSGVASLRDHLCLCCGAPLRSLKGDPEAAALLLFAAVHVTAYGRPPAALPGHSSFREIAMDGVIADAMEWLRSQLPAFAFATDVEDIIGSAVALKSHQSARPRSLEA